VLYQLVPENSTPAAPPLRSHPYSALPGRVASLETDTPVASAPVVVVSVAAAVVVVAGDDPAAPEIVAGVVA